MGNLYLRHLLPILPNPQSVLLIFICELEFPVFYGPIQPEEPDRHVLGIAGIFPIYAGYQAIGIAHKRFEERYKVGRTHAGRSGSGDDYHGGYLAVFARLNEIGERSSPLKERLPTSTRPRRT